MSITGEAVAANPVAPAMTNRTKTFKTASRPTRTRNDVRYKSSNIHDLSHRNFAAIFRICFAYYSDLLYTLCQQNRTHAARTEPFSPFWLKIAADVHFRSASRPWCRECEGIDVSGDGRHCNRGHRECAIWFVLNDLLTFVTINSSPNLQCHTKMVMYLCRWALCAWLCFSIYASQVVQQTLGLTPPRGGVCRAFAVRR
jgi:hypothetical protein